LEEHGHGCNGDSTEHWRSAEQGGNSDELELEGIPCCGLRETGEVLSGSPFLKERLCLDLEELDLDQWVVYRYSAEACKCLPSFLFMAVVYKPAGRERHEKHADAQDQSRGELKSERDHAATLCSAPVPPM